jgi:hypothetical protein
MKSRRIFLVLELVLNLNRPVSLFVNAKEQISLHYHPLHNIQWVSGALSLGVKRPGHEADHSPPSSAEVKNAWSYTSTPPIRLHGVVLS